MINSNQIIMTGTRVYGPARKDSDYDFVVPLNMMRIIEEWLRKENINMTLNSDINPCYQGITFTFGGVEINLIVAGTPDELECWKEATEKMSFILPIKNREERIKKFREFYTTKQKQLEPQYYNSII